MTDFTAVFDELIDRRGTLSAKWDKMQDLFGVDPEDGLSMWVADMDFRAPPCVLDAVTAMNTHGVYGYMGDYTPYTDAIAWWMRTRHGWEIEPDWIFTAAGLCNAIAIALDTYTKPGDRIVLFSPVYHAFAKVIRNAGREVVEMPLAIEDGRYVMDLEHYETLMTGGETMAILCSPHNPAGRVWRQAELTALADFVARHDLLLISDEIHQDLVFPGGPKHLPMAKAAPEILDRLIMMNAPSKTFNTAGLHTGNVIIPDDALRAKFAARMTALNMATNSVGVVMTTAAYSPEGAEWVDGLMAYLDRNRQILADGLNAVPGLSVMPMEATYLAWVDFSGTGMEPEEFTARVQRDARIAANHGPSFGAGGAPYLRFNFGTQRSRVEAAVARVAEAFGDLQ